MKEIKQKIKQCLNKYKHCYIYCFKSNKKIVIEEEFYSNLSNDILYLGEITHKTENNEIEKLLKRIGSMCIM